MKSKPFWLIMTLVALGVLGLAACQPKPEDPDVVIARQACEQTTDPIDHYRCLERHAIVNANPAVCQLTGVELESRCLQAVYRKAQTSAICDKIYLEAVRQECQAYYANQLITPSPSPTATPTPSPTPTPTPTPLGELPLAQILPAQVTPPPDAWYPERPGGSPARDPVAWLRAHVQLMTDLLNSSADVEEALTRYATLIPGQEARTEQPAALWFIIAELDNDGAYEWLISAPRLDQPCSDSDCRSYLLIYRYQDALFVPAGVLSDANWPQGLENLRFISVEDVDGDGKNDLILRTQSGDMTQALVGRWAAGRWTSLNADPIAYPNSEILLEDVNGDGLTEILLHGGVIDDPKAGLQRPRTRIYTLRFRRYVLDTTLSDADEHPYYRMLDAQRALNEGDLFTALTLAESVLHEGDYRNYAGLDAYSEARIVPYAGTIAMLARAQLDQPGAVAEIMIEIEKRYGESGSPFVDGARTLWHTYRRTQDPVKACQALEEVIFERLNQASFFEHYGYATERLDAWDVCPLDEKPRSATRTDL